MPCSWLYAFSRSTSAWSRTSPTKRKPFASAAGPRNSGSDGGEVAARAMRDAVLLFVRVQPLDIGLVAHVADEAEALRERRGAEELRVGLHRVALGDAAATHDAERLLVDHVHLLLRD